MSSLLLKEVVTVVNLQQLRLIQRHVDVNPNCKPLNKAREYAKQGLVGMTANWIYCSTAADFRQAEIMACAYRSRGTFFNAIAKLQPDLCLSKELVEAVIEKSRNDFIMSERLKNYSRDLRIVERKYRHRL